jgi:hypothetical protein
MEEKVCSNKIYPTVIVIKLFMLVLCRCNL